MSYYDYEWSRRIALDSWPFYALIMAAMRDADTDNLTKLQVAFPETWAELFARYNANGGLLPGEVHHEPEAEAEADLPPATEGER